MTINLYDLIDHGEYRQLNIPIAKALGSNNAALFLSEIINRYRYHKTRDELVLCPAGTEEWFFYTTDKGVERMNLSKHEQVSAAKILIDKGLIQQKNFGSDNKRHFKLIHNNLRNFLNGDDLQPVVKKTETGSEKNGNPTYIEDNHIRDQSKDVESNEVGGHGLKDCSSELLDFNLNSKLGLSSQFICSLVPKHGEVVVMAAMKLLLRQKATAAKTHDPILNLEGYFLKLLRDPRAVHAQTIEKNRATVSKFRDLNPWLKIRLTSKCCTFTETGASYDLLTPPKEFHNLLENEIRILSKLT